MLNAILYKFTSSIFSSYIKKLKNKKKTNIRKNCNDLKWVYIYKYSSFLSTHNH